MSSLKPTNVIRTLAHAKHQHGLKRLHQANVQGNSEMDKTNPKGLQYCSLIQQGVRLGVTALSLT